MSTRSYICIENEDGTYIGIYCHSDGYITHNGAILIDHYNNKEQANGLIALGNLSFLQPKLAPDSNAIHGFEYKDRQPDVTVAYGRDRGESDQEAHIVRLEDLDKDCWIEYVYVFTCDNKWEYFESGELNKELRDVKDELLKLFSSWGINRPKDIYGYYTPLDIAQIKAEQNSDLEMNK